MRYLRPIRVRIRYWYALVIFLLVFSSTLAPGLVTLPNYFDNDSVSRATEKAQTQTLTQTIDLITQRSQPRAPNVPWPMFGKDKYHTHKTGIVKKGIHEPNEKWDLWPDYITGNSIDSWASTIGNFTFNIIGDYDENMHHVVYADNGFINVVDGGTGEFAWRLDTDLIDGNPDNDLVFTTPTLGYVDNNQVLDIIFGTNDGLLYMYEPTINYNKSSGFSWSTNNVNLDKVWEFNSTENFTRSSPVLDKINADNFLDVVIGAGDKLFAVSGANGQELWNQTLPGNIISTPVVYEQGTKKRVMVTAYRQSNLNYSASFFDAETGTSLDVLYYDLGLTANTLNLIPSAAVSDLDGSANNDVELVVCTPYAGPLGNGQINVYHTNRTLLWSTAQNPITGQLDATPAIGDLDGDDIPEIVIVSWTLGTLGPVTHIYAFHGDNGTLLWHITEDTIGVPTPPYTNERAVGSPIIADLNSDDQGDVLFATSPSLFAVSGTNGSNLWQIPLSGTGRQLWSTPAADDVDHDGFLDVLFEGMAVSHVLIDLTLTPADLYLSSENVTENQQVTIHAVIRNNGSADANNIKVSFFENDVLIGNATKSQIPAFGSREVLLDWVPEQEGLRTLKVVVDPDSAIEEINEQNNEQIKDVTVLPSYPDLVIDSVQYFRGDGTEVDNNNKHLVQGEDARILIHAKNIGNDEANDILVRMLDGSTPVGSEKQIDMLDIQEIKNVTVTWQKPNKGLHNLKFRVAMKVPSQEADDSNNELTETVEVIALNPADATYIVKGTVYQPGGFSPAVNIDVRFTNNRTGSQKSAATNDTGYYSMDLKTLPGMYQEGDEILLYASDGENATNDLIKVYSEDRSATVNLTLVKVPTYAISISVDDASKNIKPNGMVEYKLTITNRGNDENNVNLSISDIIDVETNENARNWTAFLNQYTFWNIPPKGSIPAILNLSAPAKRSEARANDQVLVAVTAKSGNDPSQVDIVGMTTTVTRIYEFSITVDQSSFEMNPQDNRTTSFNVKVKNNGNDDDTVNIEISGSGFWFIEYNSTLDLKLDEEKEFKVKLTADEFIPAGRNIFLINVTSIDDKGLATKTVELEILRPDLAFLSNVTMTPEEPKIGEEIMFRAVVQNLGSVDVELFILEFWVDGLFVDSEQQFDLLIGNQVQVNFNWTPTKLGQYKLEFKLDPQDLLVETDEENNYRSIDLDFEIDIAISNSLRFSNSNPMDGDTITITITLENNGNVDINDGFTVIFYDGSPESGSAKIITEYFVDEELPILVGKDIFVSVNWKVTGGGRDHTIYVEVNSDRDIVEVDYDNNIVQKEIMVRKKAVEETDYSMLIVVVFIIAIALIVFLIMTPTKQPGKGAIGKRRPAGGKPGKGGKKEPGKKPKTKLKEVSKGKIPPKKDVKFKLVGDEAEETTMEEAEEEEVDELEEVEEVEDEEGAELTELAEVEEVGAPRFGRTSLGGMLSSKLGTLVTGRGLRRSRVITDEEAEEESYEEVEEAEEVLAEVEPEIDEVEEDLEEVEVTEVEVVSEEPPEEVMPEDMEDMEADLVDEAEIEVVSEVETVEELDEVEEPEAKLKDEKKKKKVKRKKEPGWEYSQMIGIR
jgi:uncharacterized repeat protein (TIGR01451 family)